MLFNINCFDRLGNHWTAPLWLYFEWKGKWLIQRSYILSGVSEFCTLHTGSMVNLAHACSNSFMSAFEIMHSNDPPFYTRSWGGRVMGWTFQLKTPQENSRLCSLGKLNHLDLKMNLRHWIFSSRMWCFWTSLPYLYHGRAMYLAQ